MGLKCKSVIEIGCGTGKNTLMLSQIAEKVYAIDFSAQMLEKAKEKVSSANVIFITGNITGKWACSNESADLSTSLYSYRCLFFQAPVVQASQQYVGHLLVKQKKLW